ncbi:MAG TPA: amino acid adenylation domain-containing protein [Thermoanaerobaculia bacterium]|nr:amino acid adenylation domain-containing protein [Thermoanaerobaculia bacterium]
MLALLELLKERRIAVSAVDGALRVKAPKGAVDAEIDRLLKRHKEELLEFLVRKSSQQAGDDTAGLVPVARSEASITSFPQQRLWFVDQLEGGSAQYNIPSALRLKGKLDRDALQRSLDTIVERHEVLRTTYRAEADAAMQVVRPFRGVPIRVVELRGKEEQVQQLAREEASATFDLAEDLMLRVVLLELGEEEHVLLFTMHHIASDGWSMGVLVKEFVTLYGSYSQGGENPLPPLPLQYADYAHWQRERLQGDGLGKQLDYWKNRLDGIPQLHSLPLDKPRGARQSFIAGRHQQRIERSLVDALQGLAREQGATLFMVLQSAYALLLARWSGANDVVMAVPSAGRTVAGVEPLIGFFINTLVFRNDFSSRGDSFREVLGRARKDTLETYANQQIPFEMLVDELRPERALSYNPLAQIKFVLQNHQAASGGGSAFELPGLVIEPLSSGVERIRFDLDLTASESPDALHLSWSFKEDLFEAATVERMANAFRVLLEGIVARPDTPVHALPLLDPAAEQAMLALSRGEESAVGRDVCVHQAFEAQAERTPHAPAIRFAATTLTFAELNAKANRLAHYLLEQGLGQTARVGLYAERSPEVLIGMLAILKAGAAYVPFEPSNTADRLRHVIANGGIEVVLTQSKLVDKLPVAGLDVVTIDDAEWLDDYQATNPDVNVALADSAYVIYTSGSTGVPKGVEILHSGLIDYLAFASRRYYADHLDGSFVVTSHGFDITVPSLYLPLMRGGCVTLTTPGNELTELAQEIDRPYLVRMTPMHVTGLLALLTTNNQQPATFVIGGEQFPASLARDLQARFPHAQIFNHYGPTETVVGCALFDVTANRGVDRLPIGKPMQNTQLYVLNEAMQLAPIGVPGELHIGGAGVAKGYVNQPELTAKKFVDFRGERVYKSGDLVRRLPGGDLEFLGRFDDQIKIRGFRIELGEIETAIKAGGSVQDALIVASGEGENKQLVAYIVGDASLEEVKQRVKKALPEYMVPSAWCALEAFPLNANGKIDRKRLPAVDRAAAARYIAPTTESEQRLAAIWSDILKVEGPLSVTANFFELGGHSLLATRVVSAVSQLFGKSMPVRTLFEHNTVRALAAFLDAQRETGHVAIPRASRGGKLPLSFGQQRLWFIDQMEPDSAQYNMPLGLRLRGALDRHALQHALDQLIERHEVLRTVYRDDAQVILPAAPLVVTELAATEEELQELARAEAKKVFRLDRDPMLRVTLIHVAQHEHVLLFTMHHIASDAWSLGIVVREFVALYRGEALPPLPIQYADFAAWQRATFEGEAQLAYWKEQLGDAPPVHSLPLDFPRSARQRFEGARVGHLLRGHAVERLQQLARAHNTSLFMVLQAAFALLVGRWSNEKDIVMGTPVAGRNHRDAENLVGLFLNTLVLRTRIGEDMDFHALIEQARETHLGAHQHGEVPFEAIVETLNPERSLVHAPLFQLLINMNNTGSGEALTLPGLQVDPLQQEQSFDSKYDITLYLKETDGGISCVWAYNSHLFRRDSIELMAGELGALVEKLTRNPELPVLQHGWGQTWREAQAVPMQAELIHRRIELHASDAVAVIGPNRTITYRQLHAEANRLARHLRGIGVNEGDRVAIYSERNETRILAVLAILKAGAVYVPLSQELPQKRLEYMATNARSKVLLTDSASNWSVDGIPSILLDDPKLLAACAKQSTEHLDSKLTADSPAHIIYTSGSTGNPKGVLGTHGATVNRADWMLGQFPFAAGERASHITSMAFIRGIWELFTPLCAGVPLVLFDRDVVKDPSRFVPALREQGVTRMVTAPSLMRALLDHGEPLDTLRYWFVSGEALSVDIARRVDAALPNTGIFNLYGSTEVLSDVLFTSVRGHEHTASVPLGKPIDNVAVTIVDSRNNPVPDGVVGQIVVTGRCVAHGYEGLEELSKRQFIDTPAGRGYRTGDLGRVLPCGNVEYLGRIDHQTKIRGYRIEPGEIEAQLNALEGISSAAVVTRNVHGETRLFAYLVFEKDRCEIEGLGRVKRELKAILPEFMIPSAFTVLPELPLTANGKVNRKALPEPDVTASIEQVAPRTATERELASIWGELLKLEQVSVTADFFELGGHSLLATRAASAISQRTGKKVTVRNIFEHNTVEALAAWLDGQPAAGYASIPRVPRAEPLALSFAQQRLWFIDQLEGGSAQYNIPFALRLTGQLQVDKLQHAFDEIVRRHEVVRSTYHLREGAGVQVVHEATPLLIERAAIDAAAIESEARNEATRPFDLTKDLMLRAKLLTISQTDHVLLVTMHHIASDGWSIGLLVKELVALYGGKELAPLPIQYADYAAWQRTRMNDGEQVAYWKKQLSGAPGVHSLPLDRPRPAQQQFAGRSAFTHIGKPTLDALNRLAADHEATLFMVLQTAFSLLLGRWSGTTDIVIGTPVAGRTHKDAEELLGFFVNTLVLRNELALDKPFTELLESGRKTILDAFSAQDVPFEMLVEELRPERSLSHAPVYQIVFVLQNNERVAVQLPGLELSPIGGGAELAKVDLTLSATESPSGLSLNWNYPVSLFEADTIERLAASFQVMIEAIVAKPETLAGRLPILTAADEAAIVARGSNPRPFPPYKTLHALFEEQARWNPNAIAVRYEDRQLTYAELNGKANQVARYLQSWGVQRETLVGICIDRSIEMVIGLLGILKAGGAYVPLDPGYPKDRLMYMLENSGVRVVVSQSKFEDGLGIWSGQEVLSLDDEWHLVETYSTENLGETSGLDDLAYMIYTSGSTGKPKGAMNVHRGICNRLYWMQSEYNLVPGDRILQKTPFSFDVSVWEFFWPLITGTTIVVAKPEGHRDGDYLAELIEREQITTVHFVPSMLSAFLKTAEVARCTSLRRVICSGEALQPEQAREFFRHFDCELHNLYGPTEAAVDVTNWECTADNIGATVPIGRAIANTQMYVLDANLRPVPDRVPGELFIGGVQVGRGYHQRPELTAERFIADPFSTDPAARLYRTGDLARYRTDGVLEFLGRLDDQVKIRGFRIELGEIQAQLLEQARVKEALVIAREQRLIAYLVPHGELRLDEVKEALRRQLPDYMVPAAFVVIDAFPVTSNGKVDRRALPEPEWQQASAYAAPRNATEETLAAIWARLLKLQRVGIHDNFFSIGGDSILSIQAVSRANQVGIGITTRQLFEHQTIAALAAQATSAVLRVMPQEAMTGAVELLPIQQQFLHDDPHARHHFNQSVLLETPPGFDARFLREMVAALYARHDALRLRFRDDAARGEGGSEGGAQRRVRGEHHPLTDEMIDASAIVEPATDDLTARCNHWQRSFDLERGPLFRAILFEEPARLFLLAHHIVVDGVSWRILLADIEQAYRQYTAGQPIVLGPKTSSFQQWAAALSEYAQTLEHEQPYWLAQYDQPVSALPTDFDAAGPRSAATTRRERVRLDATETEALIKQCAPVYRTTINELLLSGVYLGMRRWTQSTGLRIALEGHGREELFEQLDTTQTVGWFTTVFPLTLSSASERTADVIKSVKEQYRALPHNGIGYGVLRYMARDEALVAKAEANPLQLVFNYLGQFDQTLQAESGLQGARESSGERASAERSRKYQLGLNGRVAGGVLEFSLDYSAEQYRPETMAQLARFLEDGLREVIQHCLSRERGELTPSDFPLADVTQPTLDQWQQRYPAMTRLYPATAMQQGMLFHSLLDSGAYITQSSPVFTGPLDTRLFREAWNIVVARHDIFRTAFVGQESRLHQLVVASAELPWHEEDWRAFTDEQQRAMFDEYLAADRARGIDVETPPLQRIALFRLGEERYRILWSQHHMLLDGWCKALVHKEVLAAYLALVRGETPRFAEATDYERYMRWLRSRDEKQALAYWAEYLKRMEAPTPLVVDRPRPMPGDGRKERFTIFNEEESRRLEAFAKANHTTINSLVQLAWAYLLHRYSGEPHVTFGAVISGRPAEVAGIESMIGLFINTIPVAASFDGTTSVTGLLDEMQRGFQESQEHGYLPLSEVQGCARTERGVPLFDSILIFENFPVDTHSGGEGATAKADALRIEQNQTNERTNYKLSLIATFRNALTLKFSYAVSDFAPETIELLLEHLAQILRGLPASEDIRTIEVVTPRERDAFAQWNDTAAAFPADRCIHQLFEAQAARTPEATALVIEGESMTYRTLNEQANVLAHRLIAAGVEPDTLVGLSCPRSFDLVIGLLGILKAGGAYVPLDPSYPTDRLQFMLEDSGAKVLVTTTAMRERLPLSGQETILADLPEELLGDYLKSDPVVDVQPTNLAYVVYTSGSTGTPKGVLVEHRGFVNLITADIAELELDVQERVLHCMSLSFDAGIEHLFNALCSGAATYMVEPTSALITAAREHRITQLRMPAALLEAQEYAPLPDLKLILVGGEAPSRNVVATWSANARFYNQYGPSECTVTATMARLGGHEVVHIGRFIANQYGYVVDKSMNLCPVGVPGELLIGGAGVARGYLDRDELTRGRFIADPFRNDGARVYRTGDYVRWLPDGNLEFVGRRDDQVKIRGYRIELGEVESRLRSEESVQDAVVIARGEGAGKRLVAYLIPSADFDLATLQSALRASLPEPMIPSDFVVLEAFPLTPNGKVDKRALPEPGARPTAELVLPRNPLEQTLAEVWARHLELDAVGIDDRFYDLGGHSLTFMSVVAELKRRGIEVTMRQAMENQTIRSLAAALGGAPRELAREYIVRLSDGDTARKLFVIHPFGGKVDCYTELARALEGICTVYGVQAPFNFNHALPFSELHELAAEYARAIRTVQPAGPYRLAGWSAGGTIAWEVAHLLEDVDYLGLFDAPPPGVLLEERSDFEYLLMAAQYADADVRKKTAHLDVHNNFEQLVKAVAALVVEDETRSRMTRAELETALRFGIDFSRSHARSRELRLSIRGATTLYTARQETQKVIPAGEVERLLASPLRTVPVAGEHKHLMTGQGLTDIVTDAREELSRVFGTAVAVHGKG